MENLKQFLVKNKIKTDIKWSSGKGSFMKKMIVSLLVISAMFFACTSSDSTTKLVGTADSGGGNGIENKAYESYIINPRNLPAFKNILEPKIKYLAEIMPKNNDIDELEIIYRWLFYKTWFLAPVELETISKETIGVSFSKNGTEQLAIQSKKSVWLDSRKFSQMTEKDQAALIAHEMVMSLYYLKNKSWDDVCKEKIYYSSACGHKESMMLMNELFPGLNPQPYNSDDYENIRRVTGIFLGEYVFSSYKDLDDMLIVNSFDRRFTVAMGLDVSDDMEYDLEAESVQSEEYLDPVSIEHAFKQAKLFNSETKTCIGINSKSEVSCRSRFVSMVSSTFHGNTFGYLEVSDDQGLLNTIRMSLYSTESKIRASVFEYTKLKKKLYIIMAYPNPYPTPLKVGEQFRSGLIYLTKDISIDNAPMKLTGIVSSIGVVYEIGTQNNSMGCKYAKPSSSNLNTDTLVMFNRSVDTDDYKTMRIRSIFLPPFTFCR